MGDSGWWPGCAMGAFAGILVTMLAMADCRHEGRTEAECQCRGGQIVNNECKRVIDLPKPDAGL